MRQLDRQTISALFVALALVLAIGPAMGLAGASVQTGDDGTTNETADSGAQNATANYTTNGTADHTIQTQMTVDRITIDRISTDYLTVENLTIEGLNTTSTAVGAMFGAAPSDMEGVTVENGTDDAADESDETDGDAGWYDGDDDESEDDAVDDDADDADESEDDTEDSDSDDVEDAEDTDDADDSDDADDAEDHTEEDGTDDADDGTDDADDGTEDDTEDGTDDAEDDAEEDADDADADDGTDDADDAEDDAEDEDSEDDEMEPIAPSEPEGDSYNVSDLEAPENATVGDQLDVTAEISNPNEEASNQSVEFRLDGDVVERQYLELDGEENETATFEIDTEGLEAGDYNHGVLTFDQGEVDDISLEDADEEEDDEEEAPVDDGEDEADDEGEDEEADDQPEASVTFEDQETDGSTVTVDSVNVSEGGFVTIHDSSLLENETFDSVVGTSEYLEPGEHEDVEVQLYDEETVPGAEFDQDALEENQTLIAMPHLDSNDNETYDFIETEGEEDGSYTEDDEAVTDDAEITIVDGDDADEEEATDGDEADGDETDDDAETNATLDVQDQSGDGETLSIAEASADEDFYVVASYDGETSESDVFAAVEERLQYTLPLDPPIENDASVEVAILSDEDDEELASTEIEYDVEDDADADETADDETDEETDGELNETDGEADGELNGTDNETDGEPNETDGDATGVDDNETAALIA